MNDKNRKLVLYDKGDRCYFTGVNYEAPLKVLNRKSSAMMLKVPSRQCWCAIGTYHTAHPHIIVCRILDATMKNQLGTQIEECNIEMLLDKEYERATRKEAYNKALEIFEGIK